MLNYLPVSCGCWLWLGAEQRGYGYIGRTPAHRRAYETFVGPIPAGLHIDHLCSVRACVNPAHLEPVTQEENNRRAYARMRSAGVVRRVSEEKRKTHCKAGHEFSAENTLTIPTRPGWRICRTYKSVFNVRSKMKMRT